MAATTDQIVLAHLTQKQHTIFSLTKIPKDLLTIDGVSENTAPVHPRRIPGTARIPGTV